MSNKIIKKVNLDFFVVDVSDPNYFVVVDNSEWGGIEAKPAIIEVYVPGFSEPATHYYTKKGQTNFNSLSLNLNCDICEDLQELPDGIYTITIKGSPEKYQKTRDYLRTTKLELDIDRMLMRSVDRCDDNKSISESYSLIQTFIRTAKAHLRHGNSCEAFEFYQKAKNKAEWMINCQANSQTGGCGCNCND